MSNCFRYIIPTFLLLASGFITVWTGYVLEDNHKQSTFQDSPNYIPVINVIFGVVTLIVFLSNLTRIIGCFNGRGWCDSSLGLSSFLLMIGTTVALFVQVGMLTYAERYWYKDNLRKYYELTIGQCIYFICYVLLVLFQYLFQCCCCCADDNYDMESNKKTIYA